MGLLMRLAGVATTAAATLSVDNPSVAMNGSSLNGTLPSNSTLPGNSTLPFMVNLVTFGDSYTDEGRFNYFNNFGRPPPLGAMLPPSSNTFSGGFSWARLVAKATGARLYNYAVGGAMCSDGLVSRHFDPIDGPFPCVAEYELPTFREDLAFDDLYPDRRANNTVYALWIGTNDLGIFGFLDDSQRPNATLSSFVECIWAAVDSVYQLGGRQFVIVNQLPLDLAPMYASAGRYGEGNVRFRKNPRAYNMTEFQNKLREYTTSVNSLLDYGAPFFLRVRSRWPGATMTLFDAHSLFADVRADPGRYLDDPADVDGVYRACLPSCVVSRHPRSSFMWYDELHPSERMEEILADNFIDVVQGASKYGTTYQA